MNGFLTVLALENAPEIFGPVPLTEPGLTDAVWFQPSVYVSVVILLALLFLLIMRMLERSRRAKTSPEQELRIRLELLHAAKSSEAFYSELASIMREAIGLCFGMSAAPRTVRELEQALTGKDTYARAEAAMKVLRQCEAILFSGNLPEDYATLLADADTACRALLPNVFSGSKGGAL